MRQGLAALHVRGMPKELQRGLRMVCARRQTNLRTWVILQLYELVDAELADYPEWRYETARGEEKDMFRDWRRSAREEKESTSTPRE